jgi:SAM-dependent methyltransferase
MGTDSSSVLEQQLVLTESTLGRFTGWMFDEIRPWLGRVVWEAGCGSGTYTEHMRAAGCARILATDIDPRLLAIARRRFAGDDRVRIFSLDLGVEAEFRQLDGEPIDTIVCLNVLEHVADDRGALARMRRVLAPGGTMVLLVPAHPILYNGIDASLHHCRRYTSRDLRAKLVEAGFRVRRMYHFNALGLLGWFIHGTVLRKLDVREGAASFFDRLVPAARWVEQQLLRRRVGVSLIAICEPQRDAAR